MMVTYFVVQSFQTGRKGIPFADMPVQVQSRGQAERLAARLAATKAAVVAFSRTGDPRTGEFDDAVTIALHGDLPEDADDMAIPI